MKHLVPSTRTTWRYRWAFTADVCESLEQRRRSRTSVPYSKVKINISNRLIMSSKTLEDSKIFCYNISVMKKDIHPKYEKVVIKCACGNEIETRSTHGGEMHVELCSACHPFFTGKQKFIDTAGRVDKFKARLEAAEKKKGGTGKKANDKEAVKSNKEKLEDIKKEITGTVKTKAPGELTQQISSDEELAASEELEEAKNNK